MVLSPTSPNVASPWNKPSREHLRTRYVNTLMQYTPDQKKKRNTSPFSVKIQTVIKLSFLIRSYQNVSLDWFMLRKRCDFLIREYIPRTSCFQDMSRVMRKPTFCICENKDADQLRGNREADQRLCFRYTDSTIPLLSKSEISSL